MTAPLGERAKPMPARGRTVYLDERNARGWWDGVPETCGHCGGAMTFDPPGVPTPGPGRVFCLHCGRETHEVLDRRAGPLPAETGPRRGRPQKAMLAEVAP